jgi:hypothetical protein
MADCFIFGRLTKSTMIIIKNNRRLETIVLIVVIIALAFWGSNTTNKVLRYSIVAVAVFLGYIVKRAYNSNK